MTTVRPEPTSAQLLSSMMALVATEFEGKLDKGDNPYFMHCYHVMYEVRAYGPEVMMIALGHDLIEDRGKTVTYARLAAEGYPSRVIEGIRALTKVPGESYEEYKAKVKLNPDAVIVKMADIRHNSDIRRLKGVTGKDIERTVEYLKFYEELKRFKELQDQGQGFKASTSAYVSKSTP